METTSRSPATVCHSETLQSGRVSRIIQIHPTLNCNLCCQHCYSSSAPWKKGGLEVKALVQLLEQATPLGYNVVSLSGGEPFLYPEMEQLVTQSKSLGYYNSVTTNATLLQTDRAKRILKLLDLVAVSIDGKEEAHDRMRNQEGAFAKMLEGVEVIKDSVNKYGFIHTILPGKWPLFPWLTEFALRHKASLLHLHPLELSGRATQSFNGMRFSEEDLYKIYISHYYLKTYYEKDIFLQLDLLHKDSIIGNPNFIFHQYNRPALTLQSFSALFKELIIDEKGNLLPIAHGCSPFFTIGSIYSGEPLEDMIGRFMEEKLEAVIGLYNDTYREIMEDTSREIFNWSERVIEKSYAAAGPVMAS
jgi:MoaA/NifB/PqqE/SkfB family radical SAM enzyme